jgi:outer membrane receptor protein involved in Fe transport
MTMRVITRILTIILTFSALGGIAYAEDLPLELAIMQEIPAVSIASFTEKETVFNSVSTVSVLDRETLERYHFATVSEAVETVAGMAVYRTYMKRGLATSRGILQEMYANKVLIMINNVPSWNACTGEGELDRVGINEVERIEVLKGPASVLYGSNAYTGAINIVLKQPTKDKSSTELVGGFGSDMGDNKGMLSSFRSGAMYTSIVNGFSLMLAANASNDAGPDFKFLDEGTAAKPASPGVPAVPAVPRQSDHISDYYNLRNFTLNAGYGGHSLLINAASHDELFMGNNITVATGLGTNEAVQGLLLNYKYDYSWEKLQAKYSMTYDWDSRDLGRSADGDTRSSIIGSRFVNTLDGSYNLWDAVNLELGGANEIRTSHTYDVYKLIENQITADDNMSQKIDREWSVFGQADYHWQLLKLLVGTRYTQNQQFGSNLSSRGSLVCSLNDTNSLKLIAGQAYRAPSFFETNFISPSPLTVFGNPDLKPEKSNSIELAYLTSVALGGFGNLFLQGTGYYATYDDDITRVKGTVVYKGTSTPNVSIYENAPQFSAKGAELELKYKLPTTEVFINGDYIYGTDGDKVLEASTGNYTYNFKYVPKYTVSGGLNQDIGPFYVSGNVNYYAPMTGPFDTLPETYVLSASVGFKQGSINHCITVRNVTDQDMSDPEYVRRTVIAKEPRVNAIPVVQGQRIDYTFEIKF